jgi:hypothetical protein
MNINNLNLLPYAAFWGTLMITVLGLVFYRRLVASHEDDSLHLEGNVRGIQAALADKLEWIDRWGKMLTVVAMVYGVALAGVYLYQVWNNVPTY